MKSYMPHLFSSFVFKGMLIVVLILCRIVYAAGEGSQESHLHDVGVQPSGRYCGLYLAHTLLKIYDRDHHFEDLIRPEYLGSYDGSSLAELKGAIENYGLYATPVKNLTSKELRNSTTPIILHVKSSPDVKTYNHYVLFLGSKDNKAEIFDPPNPIRQISFYELAPRWNGTGLFVSNKPIDVKPVFAQTRRTFILYAVVVIVSISLISLSKRWFSGVLEKAEKYRMLKRSLFKVGMSIIQTGTLVISALVCGMIYHYVHNEGFLAHANATKPIQAAQFSSFIPKIDFKQAQSLLSSEVIFIDARYKKDFDSGHIENAINIPINSIDSMRKGKVENIKKDIPVIVYCQSKGCKYSDVIAIKLLSDGFTDVSIYRGGWNEWKTKKEGAKLNNEN